MVIVDPTVGAQLTKAAQNTDDGNIRICSQTYSMYQMAFFAGHSTLKAIYFTFSPQTYV